MKRFSVFLLCLSGLAWAQSHSIGVLVLAHGGKPAWNAQVEEAVRQADLLYPTEIAFGMGMHEEEVRRLQSAIGRLEATGAQEIRVIPLLISSDSSVYRQYEYLLGLRRNPSWADHPVKLLKLRAKVRMGKALDDSPLVAQILLERALRLSRDPTQEALVLVAHGPEEDSDNEQWLTQMRHLAAWVKETASFSAVFAATLRDDAPDPVREQATRRLREEVSALSRSHRVLVVPLLISQNGIEHKIAQRLEGLEFIFSGETLLPHEKISIWIRQRAEVFSRREG